MKNNARKEKVIMLLVISVLCLTGCGKGTHLVRQSRSQSFQVEKEENNKTPEAEHKGEKVQASDEADLLSKCSMNADESMENIEGYNSNLFILPNDEYTMISAEQDFYQKFSKNPIDAFWNWEEPREGTTTARIEFACGYRDAWKRQIENTLKVLEVNLREEHFTMIKEAYKSWELYMENTTDVEKSMFYYGGQYGTVGGDLTTPMVMESAAMRTKYYAVDLLALEYALTGDMEFVTIE